MHLSIWWLVARNSSPVFAEYESYFNEWQLTWHGRPGHGRWQSRAGRPCHKSDSRKTSSNGAKRCVATHVAWPSRPWTMAITGGTPVPQSDSRKTSSNGAKRCVAAHVAWPSRPWTMAITGGTPVPQKRFAEDQFKRSEAMCRLTPVLSIPDTVSCFGDKLDGPMR
jgi:hypothetical protein